MNKYFIHFVLVIFALSKSIFASESWVCNQIEEDFSPYSNGIYEELLDANMQWSQGWPVEGHSLIRVKIINGVCYQFDNQGRRVNLPAISYHIMKIMEKEDLPDLDFVYFYGAGPELEDSKRSVHCITKGTPAPGPILAGNKTDSCTNVILFHDRMTAIANNHYSWPKSANEVERACTTYPWSGKQNQLVWYGQISDFKEAEWDNIGSWTDYSVRGSLYRLSLQHPECMEVGITAIPELSCRGIAPNIPTAKSQSISHQMQSKYQIVLDGYTCTNPGYAWRLLSNCVCLKVDSPKRQWFYNGLTDGMHYLSIKPDLSNLVETIEMLRVNDDYAYQIAQNGRTWAKENLVDETMLIQYCSAVLKRYAALQCFEPKLTASEHEKCIPDPEYKKLQALLPYNGHGFFSSHNAEALSFLLNTFHCKTVVELGSWLGSSTRHIAKCLPDDGIVFAIDHWKGSEEHYKPDRTDVANILPILYEQFLSNCIHSGLSHKIFPRRLTTLDAAKQLCVQADLIFVDASHDEESVYKDLVAWFPHLKQNGILCGDDWMWNKNTPNGEYSIQKAVKGFAKEKGLFIETHGPTFWMLKKDPSKILPFKD